MQGNIHLGEHCMQTLLGPLPWAVFNMGLWLLPSPMCPSQTETGSQVPSEGRLLNVHVGMGGGIPRCQAVRHIQRTATQCHTLEESFLGLGNPQQDPTATPELQCPWEHKCAQNPAELDFCFTCDLGYWLRTTLAQMILGT